MARWIRCVLVGWVGAVVMLGTAAAQSRFDTDVISGAERRESATERRIGGIEATQTGARSDNVTTTRDYGRFLPSASSTDAASAFGLGGHFVHDTNASEDGRFFFTLRGGYKVGRPNASTDHTNGYNVGSDLQLNGNSSPFGQFIVSEDAGGVAGGTRSASATLEWDYSISKARFGTLIGTASYARAFPHAGDSVGDLVPGLAYEYVVAPQLTVLTEYTAKNDVDGEDDYAFSAKFKLADTALRFGAGKHGRIFASLTQTFKR